MTDDQQPPDQGDDLPDASRVGEEDVIAVFPLRGALLLPDARLPLHIFETRYRNMVHDALEGDGRIGMIQPQPTATDDALEEPPLYEVGCVGEIEQHERMPDGRYVVILRGLMRFRTVEEVAEPERGYRRMRVAFDLPEEGGIGDDDGGNGIETGDAAIDRILVALRSAAAAAKLEIDTERLRELDTQTLVNTLPVVLPFTPDEKQALLEADGVALRMELLVSLLEMGLGSASAVH